MGEYSAIVPSRPGSGQEHRHRLSTTHDLQLGPENHHIVRVAQEWNPGLLEPVIKRSQVQVGKQWRQWRARHDTFMWIEHLLIATDHPPVAQHRRQKSMERLIIRDGGGKRGEQLLDRDAVEVVAHIQMQTMKISQATNLAHRSVGGPRPATRLK